MVPCAWDLLLVGEACETLALELLALDDINKFKKKENVARGKESISPFQPCRLTSTGRKVWWNTIVRKCYSFHLTGTREVCKCGLLLLCFLFQPFLWRNRPGEYLKDGWSCPQVFKELEETRWGRFSAIYPCT